MPRKPGPLNERDSEVLAVRMPRDLAERVMQACGGRAYFAAWARNVFRTACQVPIDHTAGYQEGFAGGWADANAKFRAALKKAT